MIQFLAAYAATEYKNVRQWSKFSHPIEDAKFLAEKAWEETKQIYRDIDNPFSVIL